ncbi:hypothetical protein AVEN_134215-1 [Araneus ventricosus]|uniref:DUF5641 domain-containing protein n=1 Tax=Araneus ventricosus TaxID=182803 RepID=A0A4Y2ELN4_ARAVE|nr:hypothetical protein AVEN_134215-1 [Araneus ventricosus]
MTKKRLDWPLALILELIPGPDSKVRTVNTKTTHGTVLRPIQLIFPLEIQSSEHFERDLEEPIPDSVEILSPDEIILKKYTSPGRYVETPRRLDLLNQICYEFQSFHQDSNVWRMLRICEVKSF